MTEPRAYTPNHLAEKILRSRSALEGERKQVTVLFVDVKDSMRLAERVGAEAWHRVLDRFFALLTDAIHRFEGTVNQYTGDGVMALFGAPLAHEDHAQRACHAALRIREEMRGFAQELRRSSKLRFAVRVGLNSGEVIVGAIGDDLRMDYTAQGHTVGLAARMQQSAGTGRIYLTGDTAALVSEYFELEAVGRLRVKGVRGQVRAYELRGPGAVATRIEASRARGFSRFVGRAEELARLDGALERASAGQGQVLTVIGAPGLGKSRLCEHAVTRWRAQGLSITEARCPSHGRALPFAALRELLHSFTGCAREASDPARRKRVRSHLRRLRSASGDDQALVFEFLGLTGDGAKPLGSRARRDRLFALVCGLVQERSAREPTVVAVDDVQWIDAESEQFLSHLADAVGWTRTLLLLNARPEYGPPWLSLSYSETLALPPLGEEDSARLLADLLGDGADLAPLRALVAARAAGNPLFAEEIVQSLVEQGALERSPGGARLLRPVAEISIPPNVQSLIGARIDSLPAPAKHALQLASVIGKRFHERELRAVLEEDAESLVPALRALQAADLIHPESTEPAAPFTFNHPLTQEVAYALQLQETRAERHAKVARALESVHADRLGEQASLLAHHWDAAGKRAEASRWRRLAALRVTNIRPRRKEQTGHEERR
jgi:class 3 adenylate cyclase